MKTVLQEIFDVLDDRKDEMIALRRNFHQHPELSFHETETARKIAAFYDGKDCTVMTHVGGGNGILVDIQGGKPGKHIAIRADFDAFMDMRIYILQDIRQLPISTDLDRMVAISLIPLRQ